MPIPPEKSYLGQLRKLVGKRKLISVGARAIVKDAEGRVLFLRRKDSGAWVMPAGSIELGESIVDCVRREVREETGIEVKKATPIAIYSDPRYSFTTAFGDPYQMLGVVFLIEDWQGELLVRTDETADAGFFAVDELPDGVPPLYQETLQDLKAYSGDVIVK